MHLQGPLSYPHSDNLLLLNPSGFVCLVTPLSVFPPDFNVAGFPCDSFCDWSCHSNNRHTMAGCAEGNSSCPTSQTQTLKFYSVTTISYYSIEALLPKHHWSLPGLHGLQAPAVSLWLSLCLSASLSFSASPNPCLVLSPAIRRLDTMISFVNYSS